MNSKYKTIKYKKNKPSNIEDLVSIEEPLEMVVRYKKENEWIDNSISITMRTPKNDEDLIIGLLFSEGIVIEIVILYSLLSGLATTVTSFTTIRGSYNDNSSCIV